MNKSNQGDINRECIKQKGGDRNSKIKMDKIKGNSLLDMWGLTPEEVAEAEKFIIEIEEKVDECCPIRGSKKRNQSNV